MVILVNNVINRALRLSRAETAFQGENYDARQYALDTLNDILNEMGLLGDKIPYQASVIFPIDAGQNIISIGTATDVTVTTPNDLVEVDYVKLSVDGFFYPVRIINSNIVGTNVTAPSITGRPSQVFISPQTNKWILEFFPTPDQLYTIELRAKYVIGQVDYQDNINLPDRYRSFLIYKLAKRIVSEIGIKTWTANQEQVFNQLAKDIQTAAVKDFSVRSRPPFTHNDEVYTRHLGVVIP